MHAGIRGDIDDGTPLAFLQQGDGKASDIESPVQVNVDTAIPFVDGECLDFSRGSGYARVIDQHVQSLQPGNRRVQFARIADVTKRCRRIRVVLQESADVFPARVEYVDPGPVREECGSNGAPDTGCATGDQDGTRFSQRDYSGAPNTPSITSNSLGSRRTSLWLSSLK